MGGNGAPMLRSAKVYLLFPCATQNSIELSALSKVGSSRQSCPTPGMDFQDLRKPKLRTRHVTKSVEYLSSMPKSQV
jgi:hypothetical protein